MTEIDQSAVLFLVLVPIIVDYTIVDYKTSFYENVEQKNMQSRFYDEKTVLKISI